MRTRLIAILGALAIVLAACGGEVAGVGTEPVDPDESTAPEAASDEDPQSFAEFFGWNTGEDPEAAQAQFAQQEAEIQELVRVCMIGQGFDYIPVVQPAPDFDVAFDEGDFAKEQGFGITTWYGNEDVFFGPDENWVDPNQEIIDAMSDSERDAYFEALYGAQDEGIPEIDEETGETYYTYEGYGGGCWGEAAEQVYGQEAGQGLWEEFQPELEAMYESIQSDPRIIEADAEWSACMADKGYEFTGQQAMYESVYEDIQRRFDEIVGPNGGFVDPFEGWSEDEINAFFEEKTPEEVDAFFEQAQEQSKQAIDEVALAALQQEEIELAVAASECSADMNDLYMEISREYEAEFIADHKDELESLRGNG